jgi:hypothetical protein
VPERLSIVATETLQALLNQKSKGCLKNHSLSLESQWSPRATHNPKVAGSSPAPAIKKALKECLFSLKLCGIRTNDLQVVGSSPVLAKFLEHSSQVMCLFDPNDFDFQKTQIVWFMSTPANGRMPLQQELKAKTREIPSYIALAK